jgi:hypothetical protein
VNGETWRHYGLKYWFEGRNWPLAIYARSWEEAEARAKAMRHATVYGEIHGYAPASEDSAPFIGLLMDVWCWIHNKFSSFVK